MQLPVCRKLHKDIAYILCNSRQEENEMHKKWKDRNRAKDSEQTLSIPIHEELYLRNLIFVGVIKAGT